MIRDHDDDGAPDNVNWAALIDKMVDKCPPFRFLAPILVLVLTLAVSVAVVEVGARMPTGSGILAPADGTGDDPGDSPVHPHRHARSSRGMNGSVGGLSY
jgi:hypothetical protein